uniref:HD-GYP domain-containing protein n=1 Tax=Deinococcus sp. TaxID=47478 RepID=UPI0025C005A7
SAHAAVAHTALLRQTRSARLAADLQRAAQLLRDGHALPEVTLQAAMRLVRADGAALISARGGPVLSAGTLDWPDLYAAQRYLRPGMLSARPTPRAPDVLAGPPGHCSPLLLDPEPLGLTRTLMLPLNSGDLPPVAWVFQIRRFPQPWLSDPDALIWNVLRAAARDPIHAAGPRGLERRRPHDPALSPTLISVLGSVGDSRVPSEMAGRGLQHLLDTSGAVGGALLTLPVDGLYPAMPSGRSDPGTGGFSAADLSASAGDTRGLWSAQAQAALLAVARSGEPRQQAADIPGAQGPAVPGFLSVTPVGYAGTVGGVMALLHRSAPPAPEVAPLLRVLASEVGKASERQRSLRDLARVRENTFRVLGRVLEYRSYETKGHTDRVTALALQLGQWLDLTTTELSHLRWGAYLHDLGKIAIPDDVLHKQGELDSAEREWMRRHVTIGETLLREQGLVPPEVLEVVRHHHERWDGQGYPDGLSGQNIPLLARLFAVVDIFDALTSERPYKAPWSPRDSLRELRRMAGTHLDPALVQAFMDLMASGAAPPALPGPFGSSLL